MHGYIFNNVKTAPARESLVWPLRNNAKRTAPFIVSVRLNVVYYLQVEKNLRNLDLSRNKINSLPSSIGNFKVMKTLSLSKNKISALPDDMGKMTRLENLNLSFNLLQSIPSSFQQLKHLR